MTIIDAPDGQYGVVNSAVLLASVAANVGTVTVTLPANITSVMVVGEDIQGLRSPDYVACFGVTTTLGYPGVIRYAPQGISASAAAFFVVAPSLDSQVTISWGTNPLTKWWVVGLTGVNEVDVPAVSSSINYVGSISPPTVMQIGALYGGNIQPLNLDASGKLLVSGGSSALNYDESFITSQVTLTTASTYYNIASVALAAGTWLITARFFVQYTGAIGKIDGLIGPNSASVTAAYAATSTAIGGVVGGDDDGNLVITKVVVLAAPATVYLNAIANVGGAVVQATALESGVGNASGITAVQIA